MKNGPLKRGGSCKCVRDHVEVTSTEEKGSSLFCKKKKPGRNRRVE